MPSLRPLGPQVQIRDLRHAHKITLEQLAERIRNLGVDITVAALSNIETGRKRASDRLLNAWGEALGVGALNVYQAPAEARQLDSQSVAS